MGISYNDDPEHYKRLIAKINAGADFPMYLNQNGYKLARKSAGSLEFHNDRDKIVLNVSRDPMTYFNRNDSLDKGRFFKFISLREGNFYKAIEKGLETINRIPDTQEIKIEKQKKTSKSLEMNYNIVPLCNADYLTRQRGISEDTLSDPAFKGRVFNAYHIRDNGGRIANIAFPKYDLDGNARNYILYNKPYRSRADNKIKKFRLVLNQRDNHLFYSNPIAGKSVRIFYGESAIDLLSYHEMHGKPDNFYISFGGNIYREKLESFVSLVQPMASKKKVEVISLTDNDISGFKFDLKVFAALINASGPDVYLETKIRMEDVSLHFHYNERSRAKIPEHSANLDTKLGADLMTDDLGFKMVKCIGFSDKLVLEFNLREISYSSNIHKRDKAFETLMELVNMTYLPIPTQILKSKGKDWNDDLMESKKTKYIEAKFTTPDLLSLGDKIELRTPVGPEGASNLGIIKEKRDTSVLCDFGLAHRYAIPYSAIQKYFRKKAPLSIEQGKEKLKKPFKNNTLQNNIL
ncbi:DUF3991 domain-containing protein [Flagellimonas pacifica]|uniref:Uncharacterized protein n=1 Tax=Flagellimonas pacifica TaxID=1247520 RepID=A0A285N105_9FLAO|nr:DUF3991 domain-containing protein [Allomuricauda parva]SNZ01431.1 Protein of unknown function [Allomuricauda parva]